MPPRRVPTATLGGRAGVRRGRSGPQLHWGHSVQDPVRQLPTAARCACHPAVGLPLFTLSRLSWKLREHTHLPKHRERDRKHDTKSSAAAVRSAQQASPAAHREPGRRQGPHQVRRWREAAPLAPALPAFLPPSFRLPAQPGPSRLCACVLKSEFVPGPFETPRVSDR